MAAPVKNKRDHSARYLTGEFGNHSPSWETVESLHWWAYDNPGQPPTQGKCLKQPTGLFHLRNRITPGGTTHYNLVWSAVVARWLDQPDEKEWFVSQMVPKEVEETLTLQGELCRTPDQRTGFVPANGPCGLQLFYSHLPIPQRQALQQAGQTAYGIMADGLLRRHLDPGDREWLLELLDEYPDHVIEFSSYGWRWGTEMKRMVIWEVRLY